MRLGGAECGPPCCADADSTALDAGRTMVWPYYVNGRPKIRCFMPGSMT
ncbi:MULTISPECIES: hypothetical protein [unclassified Bradyrhizobium]|nr:MULTISPECIES: hypothetical protein [unclassified Bradyrhizobium]MCA1430981.1 hypothetical protein [Bradyrhizobium sp. NBAIM16]MCA1508425.1 hypothetical protein [Bradyrhizobium sp. NBAIM02]